MGEKRLISQSLRVNTDLQLLFKKVKMSDLGQSIKPITAVLLG